MHYKAIGTETLHGHMTELFVGTVHRIAGRERDNLVPTTLGDLVANLCRSAEGIRESGLKIA